MNRLLSQPKKLACLMFMTTAFGIFGFMLLFGQPWKLENPLEWLSEIIIFVAWNLSPYLLLAYGLWKAGKPASVKYSFGSFLLAAAGFLLLLFYIGFIARPDAQNGLIFLTAAPCIWVYAIVSFVVGAVVNMRGRA